MKPRATDWSLLVRAGQPPRQNGFDARGQFGRVGRLGQIVIGSGLEPGYLIIDHRLGREHDDRDTLRSRIVPQTTADLVAVHAGHHDVQNDKVGLLGVGAPDGLLPVTGRDDLVSLALQHHADELKTVYIIVHDQDFLGHAASPLVV
jgi:hypothetical protein